MVLLVALLAVCVCVLLCHSEAQGLELMCVALGDGGTAWALDANGSLWFRTAISSSRPQGGDDHWWQVDRKSLCLIVQVCPGLTGSAACLCMSLSDQYFGLRGLRSGQSVPDAASGHPECCHGNQGASGAGGGLPVTVLAVPAKPGQRQHKRSLGRLGTEPATPGPRQSRGSV